MHFTVVGAGALGRVYGARLASSKQPHDVEHVVRPARVAETDAFVIEQVNGDRRRDELQPKRRADVPAKTDAILVTVRFDQLDDALVELVRGSQAPVVVLTPLLSPQRTRLEAALGKRLVPAMPGVSGYVDDRGVVRYWVVSVAATLLDDPSDGPARDQLVEIARALTSAGLPARLERDVASLNAATTTSFFPLFAGVNAGGGVDGVLADKELLRLALDATGECSELARKLGKVASWASLLTKYVGGFTIKPGVALAKKLYPESVRFVDAHFGPKLRGQHVAMGETILEVGRQQGVRMPALEQLVTRLRRAP
jgi:2-dehydropantoate 2-reductase